MTLGEFLCGIVIAIITGITTGTFVTRKSEYDKLVLSVFAGMRNVQRSYTYKKDYCEGKLLYKDGTIIGTVDSDDGSTVSVATKLELITKIGLCNCIIIQPKFTRAIRKLERRLKIIAKDLNYHYHMIDSGQKDPKFSTKDGFLKKCMTDWIDTCDDFITEVYKPTSIYLFLPREVVYKIDDFKQEHAATLYNIYIVCKVLFVTIGMRILLILGILYGTTKVTGV
jgi:hypothetical protein